jgi:hypothetical protein
VQSSAQKKGFFLYLPSSFFISTDQSHAEFVSSLFSTSPHHHSFCTHSLAQYYYSYSPAILKLSAFAAKEFAAANYNEDITLTVNWSGSEKNVEKVYNELWEAANLSTNRQKGITTFCPLATAAPIPKRLWQALCNAAGKEAFSVKFLRIEWNKKENVNKLASFGYELAALKKVISIDRPN